MKKYKLSVVVPVYNQEEYIYRNVLEALKTFSQYGKNFEIIVVNDGSTDGTLSELKLIKDNRLKIVSYPVNKGKGHALKYGVEHVTGNVVTFMDADLDIHPRNLNGFFPYLSSSDFVIGSKRHRLSRVNYPLKRRVLSMFYHWFVRFLFDLKVKDTQSGFKLMKTECLRTVLPKVLVKRFAFDLELLVVAKHYGFKVTEAPISLHYNFGNGSSVSFSAINGILVDTLAIAYRLYILHYYDKDPHALVEGYHASPSWRGRESNV